MTLEDISVLFGEPVELSFEQALNHEGKRQDGYDAAGSDFVQGAEKNGPGHEHVESTAAS